jgi:hypothetical protein
MAELWTCPGCGQLYRPDEPSCPICRVTRDNRGVIGRTSVERSIVKPPEDVEVHLPHVIAEASYNLPLANGQSLWTSGWLAAGEAGFFLVSAKDGLDPKDVAVRRLERRSALGPGSLFLPPGDVARVVHEPRVGYWMELANGKIPLRLPKGAWEELDALCDHFGVRHT